MLTLLRMAALIVLLLVVGLAALWGIRMAGYGHWLTITQDAPEPVRPTIPFAPLTDDSLTDPDNPTKTFRVDMARVEHDFPLSRADLAGLTPANLLALSQEEVDQLYGRLTAGPIPDGAYLGDLFFPRGDDLRPRLAEILGGIEGRVAEEKVELAEATGRSLWKGKMFYRDAARAPELHRGLPPARRPDRRPGRARHRHRPARGLAQAHPADDRRLAPVPGQAPLRPEPARRPARVGHHRLRLQRRRCPATRSAPTPWSAATASASATRSG